MPQTMNTGYEDNLKKIAFVLCDNFSSIALASAIEPLRLANRQAGRKLYEWQLYSFAGDKVIGSNGITVCVDHQIDELKECSIIILVSGIDVEKVTINKNFVGKIRYLASHGSSIGALCTASYILAKMGLLDNYVCTIHWENIHVFREEFPELDVTDNLFVIDRNRYTCAGGTAAIDMMLHFIAKDHGKRLATSVAENILHGIVRSSEDPQRLKLSDRLGINHAKLLQVIELMQQNIETPFRCSDVAASLAISPRQLERLFQKYLKVTPTSYYLQLRLDRARFLLRHTSQPIMQIAVSCGFVSASHFSKCYRERFNMTPSDDRKML